MQRMNNNQYNRREFIAVGASTAAAMMAVPSLAQAVDPTELDIAQAGPLIRSGDLSPTELTKAYLDRISRLDSKINAFITVTDEQALDRARHLEAEIARGEWRGPLHGIPIALKDNIDTAGIRTTAASGVYEDRVPSEDAEVVSRLKSAGAVILGKLNMHEFAFGASSALSHFGPVHNPWDLEKIPGGSSGGSGAAVAARLCAGALGTDTGGSIRIPAAHCGIVGLKPTYGLASIRGIVPLSVSLDHVGPMCRSVADSALMLQAIAGYDREDIASIQSGPADYASALRTRVSSMRIGIPRDLFYEDVDSEILNAVESALSVLAGMTKETIAVELPERPSLPVTMVEALQYHENLIKEKRDLYGSLTLERIMRGENTSATEYAELTYQLKLSRKAIAQVFSDVDLLVTPTLPQLPVRIEDAFEPVPIGTVSGMTTILIRNTAPFNVYGTPAVSLPCGFSREGLPVGLQICGPALGEIDVLALAHAYQRRTDWHLRTPSVI